ncbi:glycoside hydrolase family 105 protein [Collybia nuda]|uniref:Glycoside hydrolase family 105 protein n=1 Tax=Collybia nuda TaxID=64659 RepID=A0A9P5YDZ2_9AGAR|nr:glycoside hydrolase family 105 protein [Collybia nuda]
MFIVPPLCLLSLALRSLARPQSYAVWAADSGIARKQGNGLDSSGRAIVSYEHGEFQWGLRQLFELTGNRTYFDYIQAGVDNIVFANGTVHGSYTVSDFVLDPLRTGPTFLYLYEQTGLNKYKVAADIFRGQLNAHPRTAQGQFWHKLKYPNQGWLDGVYMGEIFYAQYTKTFQPNNSTAWADITSQFTLMFENTIQNATAPNNTGLMYHGYDFSHKQVWASPDRGHSPEVWDRALGWYSMALVDVLETIPVTNPGHASILNILRTLAPKIKDAADPTSGAWWLVITQPGRAKNYFESSGTAMFVYSLLKSLRLGYVTDDDGSILAAAKKAYQYMIDNWVVPNSDGTINWLNTVIVGSLDQAGDFNYYVSQPTDINDLKGLAAFVLASLEYEKL